VYVAPCEVRLATVTVTGPVDAPYGTTATIWVSLQLLMLVAGIVLKATLLLLCAGPKPLPLIVTEDPISPVVGEMLEMLPDSINVNAAVLLVTPLANTVTEPVVAPDGTVAVMLVALHDVILAAILPKVT
jgi:hypothetical protein